MYTRSEVDDAITEALSIARDLDEVVARLRIARTRAGTLAMPMTSPSEELDKAVSADNDLENAVQSVQSAISSLHELTRALPDPAEIGWAA